ncbi:hypothetical protein MUK42_30108 [Musa troglodytarum]|uniref:Uncharacterized protein n=1 Tax=Musa troglodytarum TaxID=320322 RepID=A0A9E7F9A5_9LILI|nr:hypothetical protein MUK42_30108 [Musa troglodytarum]
MDNHEAVTRGRGRPIRLEPKDGVVEQTTVHKSGGSCGWPTPGNDRDLATIDGPRGHVVVHHQAPKAGCDSRKGQLGGTPMTGGVLRSVCQANHHHYVADRLGL